MENKRIVELNTAKKDKKGEFYTQMAEIEKEMVNYKDYFNDRTVYCNCDNPEWSKFWEYFHIHFSELGLRKLISTHYNIDGSPTYAMTYEGGDDENIMSGDRKELSGDGDFRSPECRDYLVQADVVVTNPPFALFRDMIAQMMAYKKKFILMGNVTAVAYKEICPYFCRGEMLLGDSIHSGDVEFRVPDDYPLTAAGIRVDGENRYIRVKGIRWFTNIEFEHEYKPFYSEDHFPTYYGNEEKYPKLDNKNMINVDKTKEIPADYEGIMAVPITFIDKYNPAEFQILGKISNPKINGKCKFQRLAIRNRYPRKDLN